MNWVKNMAFDHDFLKALKELRPSGAIVTVVDWFQECQPKNPDIADLYKLAVETMSLLMALCKRYDLQFTPPEVKWAKQDYFSMVHSYTTNLQAEHRRIMYSTKVSSSSDKYYSALFDGRVLTDCDIDQI
jgi:hypothetical protein